MKYYFCGSLQRNIMIFTNNHHHRTLITPIRRWYCRDFMWFIII